MSSTRGFIALACGILGALAGTPAAAQEDGGTVRCDGPLARKPEEVTPADSARMVSLDAPVRIRYSRGYFEPGGPGGDPTTLITVLRCVDTGLCFFGDDPAEFVPGRVQLLGDNLFFHPDSPWEPSRCYTGIARGVDEDLPFSFCAGSTTDTTPPTLRRITQVTSTAVAARCDAPRGGFRIAAFFPPADDFGGPPASIEYLLFQTRGAGIGEPVLRSTIRNFPTDTHTMAFVLPPEQASTVICVRVAAIDGRGNVDWSDAEPATDCIDPVQGNYFYPLCAVSAPGSSGRAPIASLTLGVLAIIALTLRARRR